MILPLLILSSFLTLNLAIHVHVPKYDVDSVRRVLGRLPVSWIQDEFQEIRVEKSMRHLPIEGSARIEIEQDGTKRVYGKTPTDVLYAINAYLRNACLTQISWSNSSFGDGCRKQQAESIIFKSKKIRYFGNMVTYSYSFVWWKWPEWEKFIDWLALNGFNTVLMPLGQEILWRDVFLGLGMKRDELDEFFTSHAYLAWNRMGNLKGYGGGLSDTQMENDLELAQKILTRFQELGITPVLPTFAGFVPNQLINLFPQSKFNKLPCWNNFTEEYSCMISVSPADPLFSKIATSFSKLQKKVLGDVTNLYSADPFNEITPAKLDAQYLKHMATAISGSCRKVDKNCVWVLQSWAFSYEKWPQWAIKSFLSGVSIGNLLILDLYAEASPTWLTTQSFYGHYFVWCLLHNFGGSREIRGNLKAINKGYQLALMNSDENLMGGGIAMEAIDQNYVVYQFMIDRMWNDDVIPMNQWLKSYSESRYSADFKVSHKFWSVLSQTFYNEPEGLRFQVFLYKRPGFGKKIHYWFDVDKVFDTIKNMIPSLAHVVGDNPLFREDINDVLRALIQFENGNEAVLSLNEAHLLEDKGQIEATCEKMMQMFEKIESISNRDLRSWTESAKGLASTPIDRKTFDISSRDLLTVWGEKGENIDNAHREWSGLISNYYSKRWEYFCQWILEHDHFNQTDFNINIFNDVERPFLIS